VGRTLRIGTAPYTVVGVMPRILRFQVTADAWVPLRGQGSGRDTCLVMAKLQRGLSLENAQRWVNEYAGRPSSAGRETPQWQVVRIADLRRAPSQSRPTLLALIGGTGVLLVLACATVAGLLLVRTLRRSRELAIRLALGATKGHLLGHVAADLSLLEGPSSDKARLGRCR